MIARTWGTAVGLFAARCAASEPGFVTAGRIARAGGLSTAFVHRIMRDLCKRGILRSERGRGYRLAASPSVLPVLDVLRALDGERLFLPDCPFDAPECRARAKCALRAACARARRSLTDALARLTLDKLPVDDSGRPCCLSWRRT